MTVSEFAKYVVDNMHRATLSNAMNIADKLDNTDFYQLVDFAENINKYVGDVVVEKRIGKITAYKILVATYDCLKHYNSEMKYNKRMIIDNYIIDIWRAVNDKQE